MCKKDYGLDSIHYPTAAGLSWDAAFEFSRTEVDLITDIQMVSGFESGIRGSMTFVNNWYHQH